MFHLNYLFAENVVNFSSVWMETVDFIAVAISTVEAGYAPFLVTPDMITVKAVNECIPMTSAMCKFEFTSWILGVAVFLKMLQEGWKCFI